MLLHVIKAPLIFALVVPPVLDNLKKNNPILQIILICRSFIFYVFWFTFTLLWFLPSILASLLLPLKARHFIVTVTYSHTIIWALRLICRIKWNINGTENLPKDGRGYVIVSKHQSTWETFFIATLLYPQVPVVKAELSYLPIFGWILTMIQPIWIDRNKKTNALKQVVVQGKERLHEGISVMVFPEGTRVQPGQRKIFSKGAALLATSANAPVIAVAHNSGEYWSNSSWIKQPGTIQVVISPIIETNTLSTKEVNAELENWINTTVDKISTVVFSGEYSLADSSGKRF